MDINNYTLEQKRHFDRAKEYYNDAPINIWTDPVVLDRVLNLKAFTYGYNGLMGHTINGYLFTYNNNDPVNWINPVN